MDLKKHWIFGEIISNIKKGQHYFAVKIKFLKIFILRNFVTGKIRRSKKDYYEHKFNAAKSDIKRTCRNIHNIINTKNRKVENIVNNIIIYHDFLPTPRRGSHVKSCKTHTQSSRYTP